MREGTWLLLCANRPTIKYTNPLVERRSDSFARLSVPFDKFLIKFAFNGEKNAALNDKRKRGKKKGRKKGKKKKRKNCRKRPARAE